MCAGSINSIVTSVAKTWTLGLTLLAGLIWIGAPCAGALPAAEPVLPSLKAGFAERNITPEIGMECPGGYGKAFHSTFHDPCKVRAVVFDDGQDRVAIVSVDALIVRDPLVAAARNRIHAQTGIGADAILIHATHSHSSGPTGMVYPHEYDHASAAIQALAYQESSCADANYLTHVEDQIVTAVVDADARRHAAKFSVGVGHEDQVAFNRRFFMANGITQTHPRPGNPEIRSVAGPTDPAVGVVGVWNADGRLEGCLVNFSCHATASPPGISANYIYFVEQVIRGTFGDDCVLVFLAGASGDVTQVENVTEYVARPAAESSRFVGGRIGAEAVKVLLSQPHSDHAEIASRTSRMQISRRRPSAERVEKCRQIVAKAPADVGVTEWTFAKEILLLNAKLEQQAEAAVEVEVQAIQLGPVILLTNPAEFFCQLGLDIKAASPFPFTFPVSLANGCVGYVPTPAAFGERGGGYETRLTSYSNLDITAGTQLVNAAVELAQSMSPDPPPTRATAPPFQNNAWDYGSVPPELE
jgi:hypothetical protein